MDSILAITIYGLIAGSVGTGIGGLAAFFVPKNSRKILSFILEYAAGLMLAIVCFDLLPHAFGISGILFVLTGTFVGISFGIISAAIVSHYTRKSEQGTMIRMGYVIALGIALHNFPEGLAVGSGMESDFALGLSLAIAILLHDIPEGMAMSVPLKSGGIRASRAAMMAFASGLPMGAGALVGSAMGAVSQLVVAACLSVAGGTMLYVIFADMIPESKRLYTGRLGSLGNILGLLSGVIVSVGLK